MKHFQVLLHFFFLYVWKSRFRIIVVGDAMITCLRDVLDLREAFNRVYKGSYSG
ncbi:hypothetical protein GLYMA_04G085950v4 [Glycine max]|nr:hypothetical protein GLYMA_04G085950v4 [Glycine max]